MPQLHLTCLHPGLLTLIVDQGRPGFAAWGVPRGGALDRHSAGLANTLVGNAPEEPLLELTLAGPRLRLDTEAIIALTGADLSPQVDGQFLPMYRALTLAAGAMLSFGAAVSGCRAYLAVAGAWQTPRWLGSSSVLALGEPANSPIGRLRKGEQILIETRKGLNADSTVAEPAAWPSELVVNVQPGPEFFKLPHHAIGLFFSQTYRLTPRCSRMGYRLEGLPLPFGESRDIISSAVLPGTVQVLPSGQPVVLLADAQTTGGYYRIAQIVDADLDRLAQLKPGDGLRFRLVA